MKYSSTAGKTLTPHKCNGEGLCSTIYAYLSTLVTPGLGALSTTLRFMSLLIKADFPMFGKPTTHDLTGLGWRPLRMRFLFTSALALTKLRRSLGMPLPLFPIVQTTFKPDSVLAFSRCQSNKRQYNTSSVFM